jgi:hypothetical protein
MTREFLTKAELVSHMAKKAGLKKADAEKALEAFIDRHPTVPRPFGGADSAALAYSQEKPLTANLCQNSPPFISL